LLQESPIRIYSAANSEYVQGYNFIEKLNSKQAIACQAQSCSLAFVGSVNVWATKGNPAILSLASNNCTLAFDSSQISSPVVWSSGTFWMDGAIGAACVGWEGTRVTWFSFCSHQCLATVTGTQGQWGDVKLLAGKLLHLGWYCLSHHRRLEMEQEGSDACACEENTILLRINT